MLGWLLRGFRVFARSKRTTPSAAGVSSKGPGQSSGWRLREAAQGDLEVPENYTARFVASDAPEMTVALAVVRFNADGASETIAKGQSRLRALLEEGGPAIATAFEPEPDPKEDHGDWWRKRDEAELAKTRLEHQVQSELGYSSPSDEEAWRYRRHGGVARLIGRAAPTWSGGRPDWSYEADIWGGRAPGAECLASPSPGEPPILHCVTPEVILRVGLQKGRAAASRARNEIVMRARMNAGDLENKMSKYGVPSPDSRAYDSEHPIWDDYARPGRTAERIRREVDTLINEQEYPDGEPVTIFVKALGG